MNDYDDISVCNPSKIGSPSIIQKEWLILSALI